MFLSEEALGEVTKTILGLGVIDGEQVYHQRMVQYFGRSDDASKESREGALAHHQRLLVEEALLGRRSQGRHEALRIGEHENITQDVKVRFMALYGVRWPKPHFSGIHTNNFSRDLQDQQLGGEDEVFDLLLDGVLGDVAAEVLMVPRQPALSKPIINRDVLAAIYREFMFLHIGNA